MNREAEQRLVERRERGVIRHASLEAASLYDLKDRHVPILIDLMTGRIELAG